MNRLRTLAPYAPWLILGPVTGPLSAAAVYNAKRGKWASASFCVAGILAFYVGAPLVLGSELAFLRAKMY